MMTTHRFTTDSMEEWQRWYDRVERAGPYHSPRYLSILEGHFEQPAEIAEAFVLEADDGFVYYPYLKRPLSTLPYADEADVTLEDRYDIVSSWYYGGPLVQTESGDATALAERFQRGFSDFCRSENVVTEFIRFDPNRANHRRFEGLNPAFNRETIAVDLTQSMDEIWNGYEGRNQRAIRQAQETDIVVEPAGISMDVTTFYRIYTSAMEARDAARHYRFPETFFSSLLEDDDLATLLVARYEGSVIGGFVIVHDDHIGYHYLSASNPDYWDMRVNNLLFHEVLVYARESGREVFDFQGGRPGVFRFKKGFSPERAEFHVGRQVHVPDVYDDLVGAAERAGVDVESGYFPEYRVEQSN